VKIGKPLAPMRLSAGLLAGCFVFSLVACSGGRPGGTEGHDPAADRLVATFRSEPKTFNRLISSRAAEDLFAKLTQATLLRLNYATGQLEPRLAMSWTSSSPDGRVWTLKLRPGVVFSDGTPFTAADVQFTFRVLFDKQVGAELASSVLVGGQPIDVRAIDDNTIVLTFAEPYGPGLSLLDAIPILPRHKLEAAYQAGTFHDAWGLSTPVADLVGLGPFVLTQYVPGERLVFARNPHFWGKDGHGALPRLAGIDLQIVPEQNAELLRLEAGTADLTTGPARPEDLGSLRKLEAGGQIKLVDAGLTVTPNCLWFNLTPGAASAKDRPWLQREELRRAISLVVDRKMLADSVYLGAAEPISGPITPGNRQWYMPAPAPEHDIARAKALLASIGLVDRHGDGLLEDAAGRQARFSILTQQGNTTRERSVAFLAEQLRQIGLSVDVVTLEQGAMIEKYMGGGYDAMYFYFPTDSFDPARNPEFWLSSGGFHVWQPNQKKPARPWEASIDDLMRRQAAVVDPAERARLFGDAEKIFAEHMPAIYFVAEQVTIPMSARVRDATPSVLGPPVLWNAEVLSLAPRAGTPRQ
jgi:peptide/nickel transport system substrate-binding protein